MDASSRVARPQKGTEPLGLRASNIGRPRRHRLARRVAVTALAGGLLAGAAFATATPSALAIGAGITAPASLRAGLQRAVRLDPPTTAPPVTTVPVVTTPPGSTVGSGLAPDVEQLLDLLNFERTSRGLVPLLHHPQLAQAGAAHAADYFNLNCLTSLSHTGRDGSSPGTRIKRTGLQVSTWGENLACNNQSPALVNQAWMNSSGHRANILNTSFTHVGISITRDIHGHPYWVQVFGTPR